MTLRKQQIHQKSEPVQLKTKLGREYSLISDKIASLLVKQLTHELTNFTLYRNYANYFGIKGLAHLEQYYIKRANEELVHHEWIVKYLSEADYRFLYPDVKANIEQEVTSIEEPFEKTVVREIETTQLIYHILDIARAEGDHMTCGWLQRTLIKEQIEEENLSRAALSLIRQPGTIFSRSKAILDLIK